MNIEADDFLIIQAYDGHLFESELSGVVDLKCNNCDTVFQKNFIPEQLIGIKIQCFNCKKITEIPDLPDYEIPPMGLIYSEGKSVINRPISLKARSTIISHKALKKAISLTSPRQLTNDIGSIDEKYLSELEKKYDEFSGGALELQKKYVRKRWPNNNNTNDAVWDYPFVWAIGELRNLFINNSKANKADKRFFLLTHYTESFRNIIDTWSHLPHLSKTIANIANKGEFHHTIAQFNVAAYLNLHGNFIGHKSTSNQKTADLYIRLGGLELFNLEVKSRKDLFSYNRTDYSEDFFYKMVEGGLKKSKGQLSNNSKGILVIPAGINASEHYKVFKQSINKVLFEKGNNYSGVAGIVSMSTNIGGWLIGGVVSSIDSSNYISVDINPHFNGINPLIFQ